MRERAFRYVLRRIGALGRPGAWAERDLVHRLARGVGRVVADRRHGVADVALVDLPARTQAEFGWHMKLRAHGIGSLCPRLSAASCGPRRPP